MWEILEIEPTEDISIIKKAYAKKLRVYHPESDPVGYQRLREAYDYATDYAKGAQKRELESIDFYNEEDEDEQQQVAFRQPLFEIYDNNDYEVKLEHKINLFKDIVDTKPSNETLNEEFIIKAQALYDDFSERIEISNWKSLFNTELLWDINNREYISNRMFSFLLDHHNLPRNIWKYIDDNFNFTQQEDSLNYYFPYDMVESILNQINRRVYMSFDRVKMVQGIDYDEFLEYRENAQAAIEKGDLEAVIMNIEYAKNIFKLDPDLIRIESQFYLAKCDRSKAMLLLNQLLSIEPGHLDGLKLRASMYFEEYNYPQAITDYVKILSSEPNNLKILHYLGKCYMRIDEYFEARKCYLKIVNLDQEDLEAKNELLCAEVNVKNKLRLKSLKNPWNTDAKKQLINIKAEIEELKKDIKSRNPKKPVRWEIHAWRIIGLTVITIALIFIIIASNSSSPPETVPQDVTSVKNIIESGSVKNINLSLGSIFHETLDDAEQINLVFTNKKGKDDNITHVFMPANNKTYAEKDGFVLIGRYNNKNIIITADTDKIGNLNIYEPTGVLGRSMTMTQDNLNSVIATLTEYGLAEEVKNLETKYYVSFISTYSVDSADGASSTPASTVNNTTNSDEPFHFPFKILLFVVIIIFKFVFKLPDKKEA